MDMAKLYRKRAIDRENQRNLRHKNKQRIEQLEQELSEVRQKLEDAQREASRLTGEGMATRSSISSIIKSLQALEGDTRQQGNNTVTASLPSPIPQPAHPSNPATARASEGSLGASEGSLGASEGSLGASEGSLGASALDTDIWSEGGFVSFADSNFSFTPDFSFDLSHLLANYPAGTASPRVASLPASAASGLPDAGHAEFRDDQKLANTIRTQDQLWRHLPRYCSPTCKADKWMINVIETGKDARDAAKNAAEFASRDFPSINSLINPSESKPDTPVASAVAEHLIGIVRVHTLPEKIALLYVISHLLRWQIMPSQESYSLIPDLAKPGLAQIALQHPCWVGTIGWPEARERIIQHMDYTEYPQFATIITRTFSINWAHGLNGIIKGDSEQGYRLSSAFIKHITLIDNWTVGQELVDSFPFLLGAVNVR
ncbi:hypothetical protein LIA77_06720 [Sarocladium implicatum]|nr:hypothetical protein LIA77_06720 [Sarocladium implicatum]